jgi:hypothetical protein
MEIASKSRVLIDEAQILSKLKEVKGIPNIHLCCRVRKNLVIVEDLLGSSLERLRKKFSGKFNVQTVLLLAI